LALEVLGELLKECLDLLEVHKLVHRVRLGAFCRLVLQWRRVLGCLGWLHFLYCRHWSNIIQIFLC
jgi:hypothetical protein